MPADSTARLAETRRKSTQGPVPQHSVAVIRMAAPFAGVLDIEMLGENLRNGREIMIFFGDLETLDAAADERKAAACCLLENVNTFDVELFGLTPIQGRCLEPQQRIWLESVFHALESTNQAPDSFRHDVGEFAGGVSVVVPRRRAYGSYLGGIYLRGEHCRAFHTAWIWPIGGHDNPWPSRPLASAMRILDDTNCRYVGLF